MTKREIKAALIEDLEKMAKGEEGPPWYQGRLSDEEVSKTLGDSLMRKLAPPN